MIMNIKKNNTNNNVRQLKPLCDGALLGLFIIPSSSSVSVSRKVNTITIRY